MSKEDDREQWRRRLLDKVNVEKLRFIESDEFQKLASSGTPTICGTPSLYPPEHLAVMERGRCAICNQAICFAARTGIAVNKICYQCGLEVVQNPDSVDALFKKKPE